MPLDTASQVVTANPSLQQRLAASSLDARESAASAMPLSPTENLSYAKTLSTAGHSADAVEKY
jgi:hypothetical protein